MLRRSPVLDAITEPALRMAMQKYYSDTGGFNPTADQVALLNALMRHRAANLRVDNNHDDFTPIVRRAFGGDHPPNRYFASNALIQANGPGWEFYNHLNGIRNAHARAIHLNKITEPALRKALIEYSFEHSNWQPTAIEVEALNVVVAGMPTPFDPAMLSQAVSQMGNNAPPNNYFSLGAGRRVAIGLIQDEHAKIIRLNKISEPKLRQAMIEYLGAHPGWNPQDDQIRRLNTEVARIELLNAVNLGGAVHAVWGDIADTYFQNTSAGGVAIADGMMAAQHITVRILNKISEPALRQALIEHLSSEPLFAPTPEEVQALNIKVAGMPHPLNPGNDAAHLGGVVLAAFNVHPPAADYFNAANSPGKAAFEGINAEHKKVRILNGISEPKLRQAMIEYLSANPAWDPQDADVKALNTAVAALGDPLDQARLSTTVKGVWNNVADNYFVHPNPGGTAFADGMAAEHKKILILNKISEPALRQAMIEHLGRDPQFNATEENIKDLNRRVAVLAHNAGVGDFDGVIRAVVWNARGPAGEFFQNNGLAAGRFAEVAAAHAKIKNILNAIAEPRLRQAMIEHLGRDPNFNPSEDNIKELNRRVAGLAHDAGANLFDAEIRAVNWDGGHGPAVPFFQPGGLAAPEFVRVAEAHVKIKNILNKIVEPKLRQAMIEHLGRDPDFNPSEDNIKDLNRKVAGLANAATADLFDNQIRTIVWNGGHNPPNDFFHNNGPAADEFAGVVRAHGKIKSRLNQIVEPRLRQAMIEHLSRYPDFDPSEAEIVALNRRVAGLAHNAGADLFDQEIVAVWAGGVGVNNPPAQFFQANGPAAGEFAAVTAAHAKIKNRLNGIVEPKLRQAMIEHLGRDPGFDPSEANIVDLNNRVRGLAHDASAADFQREVLAVVWHNGHGPVDPFFNADGPAESEIVAIRNDHAKIKNRLNAIIEPRLRQAMIEHLGRYPAFAPSEVEIADLNRRVAGLAHNAGADLFDQEIVAVWAGGVGVNNPPAQFFQANGPAAGEFAAVTAAHAKIKNVLNGITEPKLRQLMIEHFGTHPDWNPTAEQVTAFNARVAALGAGEADGAHLDAILAQADVGWHLNHGPKVAANFFAAGGAAESEVVAIGREHDRVRILSEITEKALRKAMIEYLGAHPNWDPTPANVTALNNAVAGEPAFPADGAAIDTRIQAVWPARGDNPPDPYFAHPDQAAIRAEIIAEHGNLLARYDVANAAGADNPVLKKALADYAAAHPGDALINDAAQMAGVKSARTYGKVKEKLTAMGVRYDDSKVEDRKAIQAILEENQGLELNPAAVLAHAFPARDIKDTLFTEESSRRIKTRIDRHVSESKEYARAPTKEGVEKLDERVHEMKLHLGKIRARVNDAGIAPGDLGRAGTVEGQNELKASEEALAVAEGNLREAKRRLLLSQQKLQEQKLRGVFESWKHLNQVDKDAIIAAANQKLLDMTNADPTLPGAGPIAPNTPIATQLLTDAQARAIKDVFLAGAGADVAHGALLGAVAPGDREEALKRVAYSERNFTYDAKIDPRESNTSFVPIIVNVDTAAGDKLKKGSDLTNIRAAAVQTRTSTNAVSNIYIDKEAMRQIEPISGGFGWRTKIPGMPILECAERQVQNFLQIHPTPEHPEITIVKGDMPEELVRAICLYCKFKGIPYSPENVAKDLEQSHQDLFKKEWEKRFPEKKSEATIQKEDEENHIPGMRGGP